MWPGIIFAAIVIGVTIGYLIGMAFEAVRLRALRDEYERILRVYRACYAIDPYSGDRDTIPEIKVH